MVKWNQSQKAFQGIGFFRLFMEMKHPDLTNASGIWALPSGYPNRHRSIR